MQVILALSNFQIVGCLDAAAYQGAEESWPHGWKELTDRGVSFDQVDTEMPSEEMARAYIRHFGQPVKPITVLVEVEGGCVTEVAVIDDFGHPVDFELEVNDLDNRDEDEPEDEV